MTNQLRIGVVGGSIGGLTAAVLLHELGHDVRVFERSTTALEGRGAGIVVLPITERYFVERGGRLGADESEAREVALTLTNWSYVNREGEIIEAVPTHNRFTAWNTLYRALLESFPVDQYLLGHHATAIEQRVNDDATVRISFANGEEHHCDLLVGADGMGSTVRTLVSPDTATTYAGYVAWRGTVQESELSPETAAMLGDAMIYQVLDHSHILAYAIPGPDDSIEAGARSINFVWYRNASGAYFDELMTDNYGEVRPSTVPPGFLQTQFVNELHGEAGRVLSPQLAELVRLCPHPFIQAIFDMRAERLVHDRTILLGDAAAVVRPHVAAGAAKACADAWALREHLQDPVELTAALAAWEVEQLAVATAVAERSRSMGESAQVESTMVPGDPSWRFGLFGPGN